VGPSGSGKSTLLNVIGTLERPSEGSVLLDGYSVDRLADARLAGIRAALIGFVFQQFHLLRGLSAQANVAQALLYSGLAQSERRAQAMQALREVGLEDRATHRPTQLSGGEQQRVAIARAIVKRPSIVLADEPTGNLDSVAGGRIMDLLRGLSAAGTTVVMITHDRELAETFPRRILLRDGQIIGDRTS
jgi:putative ABC transport system ATP-binding protein